MKKYQNTVRTGEAASFLEVGELNGLSLTIKGKTGAFTPVAGVKMPMISGQVRCEGPMAYANEPGSDGNVEVVESVSISFNARKGSTNIDALLTEANRVLGIWKRDMYLAQGLVPPASATFDEAAG